MVVAGAVLISGVTIAQMVNGAKSSARDATRIARDSSDGARAKFKDLTEKPQPEARAKPAPVPIEVPEPEPERLIVRATHVEATPPAEFEEADDSLEEGGYTFVPEPDPEPIDQNDEPSETDHQSEDGDAVGVDRPLTPMGRYRASVVDDPSFVWKRPAKRLLTRSPKQTGKAGQAATHREVAVRLVEALGHFGVKAEVVGTVSGPHITRYELKLAPGTKVNKVAALRDDLAYALASTDIRILAPIPGKQAVGVEVPNDERQMVTLGDVWQDPPEGWSPLTVWLGKDVAGRAIGADLARMPHLLVAGTTGAGKSACVNAMLSSILLRANPREVRLVLVDPKQVELNHYESIPHLLTPVITNPKMAANALANLVREMEQRYALMSIHRTRGLKEMNASREKRGEPALPYILCVIDELADLMMVAPAEVEDSIIRLAQKARAVGIHLVLATQSPRVDVITGMIKANVPSRVAFAVSSQTDSRVILDQNGAETLLGQGDMLFAPVGTSNPQRIQGAFLDEEQVAAICDHWRKQGAPQFNEELLEEVIPEDTKSESDSEFDPDEDSMLEEAIALVAQMQTASTSMLQRRLRVGYTRAGRLIDMLERRGIISGYEGSKPRQVLISEADLPRVLEQLSSTPEAQPALDSVVDDE
jgi:S-DNA-T family DNA segregation ATPase FtsK/SpoIIIE